jgi:hypothetical protein
MYCPFCGQEQKESQHFCSNCGSDLTQEPPPAPTPPPPQSAGPAPPYRPQGPSTGPGIGPSLPSRETDLSSGKNLAYAGIAVAVIGFFFAGPILGAGAMVLGYLAMQKGERSLGQIAIAAGAIVFIISIIFVMLVGW